MGVHTPWWDLLFEETGRINVNTDERILSVKQVTSWCAVIVKKRQHKAGRSRLSGAIKLPDESFNIESFNTSEDCGRRQLRAGLSVDYDQPPGPFGRGSTQ